MMNGDGKLHHLDLAAGISFIASGGLASAAVALGTLIPSYAVKIMAVSAIIVAVAGMVSRIISNPSPPPGTVSVIQPKDTSIVPKGP